MVRQAWRVAPCPPGKRRIEYVDKGGTGLYVEVRATSPGQGTYYLRYKDDNGNRSCHGPGCITGTGHNTTFITKKYGDPKVAAIMCYVKN